MGDSYLWVKIVHILGFVSWMAGLFYLPRLFVYHAESGVETMLGETFKVMERRLLVAIMRPAGLVAIGSGFWLGVVGGWFVSGDWWLWIKLMAVGGLVVYHLVLERHVLLFGSGRERKSGRYFRVLNEVPTVLLIVIVVMVILKPF